MKVRELRLSWHPTDLPPVDKRRRWGTPADVAGLVLPLLQHEAVEVFLLVFLDTKNQLIGIYTLGRGSLDSCIVNPRDVFKAACMANASAIVTAHNHPSGDPTPSPDDRICWQRLNQAGEILGIQVLDHLVIGDGRYYSQCEAGGGTL